MPTYDIWNMIIPIVKWQIAYATCHFYMANNIWHMRNDISICQMTYGVWNMIISFSKWQMSYESCHFHMPNDIWHMKWYFHMPNTYDMWNMISRPAKWQMAYGACHSYNLNHTRHMKNVISICQMIYDVCNIIIPIGKWQIGACHFHMPHCIWHLENDISIWLVKPLPGIYKLIRVQRWINWTSEINGPRRNLSHLELKFLESLTFIFDICFLKSTIRYVSCDPWSMTPWGSHNLEIETSNHLAWWKISSAKMLIFDRELFSRVMPRKHPVAF